jgi:ribonuclease Z
MLKTGNAETERGAPSMKLIFLGTVAGSPNRERNVSSLALQLYEERGSFWLFDCGEGTQHRLLELPLKLSRLEFIFITHLHGDHLYGLPGLMTSRSYQDGKQPLTLFGPSGLRRFLDTAFELSQAHLEYEWNVVENREGIIYEDDRFVVEAAQLEHRVECWGYRITERDLPGKLHVEKLLARGVQPGPIYARIKNGENVTLDDGTVLNASEFVGPPIPGRVITILGDTRVCAAGERLAQGADVLVHEATFAHDLADLAHKYYHSTARQAAELASRCGAKQLLLTHISSRYPGDHALRLQEEARQYHANSWVVHDFDNISVDRKTV